MRKRRLAGVCLAVLALMAPGRALARPEIDDAVRALDALVKQMATASPEKRPELLGEIIKSRRALIDLGAHDDRLATWLLDQAEDVLQQAGADGAELSVLYGVPTLEQRSRVRAAATEAAELVERADEAAGESVSRLEEALFAARDNAAKAKAISEKIEPRVRVLTDVEQAWRVPMLRARASLVLAAALDGAGAQVEQRRVGRGVTRDLEARQPPDPSARVIHSLWLATAQMLAGERLGAAHRFAEIEPAGGMHAEQARLGLAASASDLVSAREAARLLMREAAQAPLSLDLLRAEAAARSILTHAPQDDPREAIQREALTELSRVTLRCLAESPAILDIIAEKSAILTDPGAPWGPVESGALSREMAYARGVALLRRGSARDTTEGAALLGRVADAPAPDLIRECALWALGTAEHVDRAPAVQRLRAAERLARLARDYPASTRSRPALERAETLVRDAARARLPGALGLQREILSSLLALSPPPRHAPDLRSLLLLNHAVDESIAPDAAALERLLTTAFPSNAAPMDAERAAADERNAWIVIERALSTSTTPSAREAVARVGAQWGVAHAPRLAHRFRLVWAESLFETGNPRGCVEQITAIGPIEKSSLTEAERVRAQLTLGRSQRAAGDENGAFATLRTLTDRLDHDPPAGSGAPKRDPAFWAAWAEMLEILLAQNADGARTPTIRLQINRLRLIDESLGGTAWKERIDTVHDALGEK